MNIILWRHADAEDGYPDLERRLTEKGRYQARLMAEWLKPRLPKDLRILVSPAVRARETADALGMAYTLADDVAPDVGVAELLTAAGWLTAGDSVLIVGHQPTLGLAASLLLPEENSLRTFKKGAVVWISRRGQENILQAAMSPDMLWPDGSST